VITNPKTVKKIKDLEVITDSKKIEVLFEPTRSAIVFKYLVNEPYTVKQLSDKLKKNPGTILHHIEKLKKAGLVMESHTEKKGGIVQRFYRATAREFRLGIGVMMRSSGGISEYAASRLVAIVKDLAVYGIVVPDDQLDHATGLLGRLIERENHILSTLYSSEPDAVDDDDEGDTGSPDRRDASRIVRRLVLDGDSEYVKLREEWHRFLNQHRNGA